MNAITISESVYSLSYPQFKSLAYNKVLGYVYVGNSRCNSLVSKCIQNNTGLPTIVYGVRKISGIDYLYDPYQYVLDDMYIGVDYNLIIDIESSSHYWYKVARILRGINANASILAAGLGLQLPDIWLIDDLTDFIQIVEATTLRSQASILREIMPDAGIIESGEVKLSRIINDAVTRKYGY